MSAKEKSVMNYVSFAKSETKLRGHGYIMHLSTGLSRCLIMPILEGTGGVDRPCDPLAKHCGLHKYSLIDHIISKQISLLEISIRLF